jgi:serine/threonine protein kinase/Tol biopolymer transport system component
MALVEGFRVGPYEIVSPLGAGGMGEVYRARDTSLNRDVAIKILPTALACDLDRVARFRREAQIAASLNHPNVAAVYGLQESQGVIALIQELVEGEDLAARITRGVIPVDEVIPLARQVAEGLEAAHEKGIIHRDLKPANIKVTKDGTVKILDFGLAKAYEDDTASADNSSSSDSPTLSRHMTEAGLILGTAAYMSPEQARGRPLDKRTDIWAFGALLFEMLTGRQAFGGETASDVVAAIVAREPDWSALPAGSPSQLIRRCLEKDPKRRLRDIGDAFNEPKPEPQAPTLYAPFWHRPLMWSLLLAALAVGALAGWRWTRSRGAPILISRLAIPLMPGQEVTSPPAISDDGSLIAYTARQGTEEPMLYLRRLDRFEAMPVTGSEAATQPFFSPDASWVAFFAHGHLWKAGWSGGAPIRLAPAPKPVGGTWLPDDTIVFAPGMGSGLSRVPAGGGPVDTLTKPAGGADGYAHMWPQALPGGRSVLFTVWGKGVSGNAVLMLDTGRWQMVLPGRGGAVFSPSGHLLVGNETAELKAAPLDAAHPARTSAETLVLANVFNFEDLEHIWLAVSRNGTAVFAQGSPAKRSLVWVDRQGRVQPLPLDQAEYEELVVSPDGTRAAIKEHYDLFVYDFQRGTRTPLTFHANTQEDASSPTWSRDSRRVIFVSNGEGNWNIYSEPADGSQPQRQLTKAQFDQFPSGTMSDGTIFFSEANPTSGEDLWALTPGGKALPLRITPFNEENGSVSPDGRWLAYNSDETGHSEVYLQSYPGGEKRVVVSSGGGFLPRWSGNGRELFYCSSGPMMVAEVAPDGSITASKGLFDRSPFLLNYNSYDVSRDGERFLMIRRDPGSIPRQLDVILSWSEDLKRLVPAGR